jgi:hypothetical protein
MTRSIDSGKTWEDVVGANVIASNTPVELSDGRIAILGTDYVLASSDNGKNWQPITSALPKTAGEDLHGIAYSKDRSAIYVWHNTCGFTGAIVVPDDAVMRYDL